MSAELLIVDPAQSAATAALRAPLERLLAPRSVAIAGVSSKPGSVGGAVLDNLERFGFVGDIHLIHPTQPVVRGRACVADAAQLPPDVDCVVLAIPVAGVEAAVRGCAARGVGGVVIFSAGFAELGPEGRALQDRLAAVAQASGMVIEGPNCLGFVNYVEGVAMTFAATEPHPPHGPAIGVVSQSGAMSSVVRAALHGRKLDVGLSVSTGNEASHGLEDFVEHLLDEGRSRVLALVAEHLRAPRRFLELARRAASTGVRLVLLHPGRSTAARAAAATHTGAMTGDHDVMRTLCARAGVLVVETLEELIDVCDILVRCPVAPRGGVAVLGESGAFKALTLDYADHLGLELPQPSGAAKAALDAIAPGFIVSSNPLDLTAQALGDPGLYGRAIAQLMDDPACGALVAAIILTNSRMAERKTPPVLEALRGWVDRRAVIFAMLGEDAPLPDALVDSIREAGIPFFRSPERALRALACFARARDVEAVRLQPAASVAAGRLATGVIPEHAAKRLLASFGLPVSPGRLVLDVDAAIEAAHALGYPVVLKVQSAALSHKSDVGGVVLNLGDDASLRSGWARLQEAVARAAPEAVLDGVLVEPMSRPGLELIVGARNDPDWGPVLAVGLGGVVAEALHDTRVLAADLDVAEIAAEIGRLKGATLLGAFRGRAPRDVTAAAQAVSAVGRFVLAHPEVAELDVNPLVVFADGEGAMALDALILCR